MSTGRRHAAAAGASLLRSDSILPEEPGDLELLHDREYRVRAYRKADDLIMIRGAVRDQQPPGLYVEGDSEPLTIHHMVVELDVTYPSMEIVDVRVGFEAHPHATCPSIMAAYDALVGLSIARGFSGKVRELFGGTKGCTHTTALLQAMAPVAVQCIWAMAVSASRRRQTSAAEPAGVSAGPESWRLNYDTCHVWSSSGDLVARIESGMPVPAPSIVRSRMRELGLDPDAVQARIRR